MPLPRQRFNFVPPQRTPTARPTCAPTRRASSRPTSWPTSQPLPNYETNVSDELSKLALNIKKELSDCGFKNLCIRHRGRYELAHLCAGEHPAAALLNHLRVNGATVTLQVENNRSNLQEQLAFGCHSSARQETAFFRDDLHRQVLAGHNLVFPLSAVIDLEGLWLSLPTVIPQKERRPRPIYNFNQSGLNRVAVRLAPDKAMQFGAAGFCLLQKIVHANTLGGPVFMDKTDISDAYMRVWIRLQDIPRMAFIVPPLPTNMEQLIGFHLSLPMGYVESAPFFCIVPETIADMVNEGARLTHPHPLETLATTPPKPTHECHVSADTLHRLQTLPREAVHQLLNYTDVHMDDFVTLCQGSPTDWIKTLRNLFHNIDKVLRPNDAGDTTRQEPNSIKTLRQGDAFFSTRKKVLGLIFDTLQFSLDLTTTRRDRVLSLLSTILASPRRCNRKRWESLLGTLWSLCMGVPGGRGMLSVLMAALPTNTLA